MAKYSAKIGFVINEETSPGIWKDNIVEKNYFGDIVQNRAIFNSSDKLNDDQNVSAKISIIANSFAMTNLKWMRYLEWYGILWKITSIEPAFPRLILTIGGVYNGEQA